MATGRSVAVGPVQGVALIAGVDPILVIPVSVVVPVQPPRPGGRLASCGAEMALAAVPFNVVAVSTLVLGHGSVKLGTFAVQPRAAQHMRVSGAMAVVADAGPGLKRTPDFMTAVTHGLVFLEFHVAFLTVRPIRSLRNSTAVRSEMAIETSRDIFLTFSIEVMTFHARHRSLRHYLAAVERFCIHELRVGPGLGVSLVIIGRIVILLGAGRHKEHQQQEADVCR
jgi:hypothetical protein